MSQFVQNISSAAPEIFIGGAVGDRSSLLGSRGKAPVEIWRPEKLKQSADIVYRFCLWETIKILKLPTIHLLILDQSVSRWG